MYGPDRVSNVRTYIDHLILFTELHNHIKRNSLPSVVYYYRVGSESNQVLYTTESTTINTMISWYNHVTAI